MQKQNNKTKLTKIINLILGIIFVQNTKKKDYFQIKNTSISFLLFLKFLWQFGYIAGFYSFNEYNIVYLNSHLGAQLLYLQEQIKLIGRRYRQAITKKYQDKNSYILSKNINKISSLHQTKKKTNEAYNSKN